ncbi:MAG: hypothetical protein J5626_05750 [Lachnospiraceae bacterium]|nr:hypothetical protein [Lachnospiraceae bacterium]
MFYYTLGSVIIIIILTVWAGSVVLSIVKSKTRGERIDKIRNYKKGRFLAIYPVSVPIFYMAVIYGKDFSKISVFECLLEAITKAAALVTVKFNFGDLRGLMDASVPFSISVYYCYFLVLLNVLLFLLSVFMQFLWERNRRAAFERAHGDRYLFIGDNEGNRKLYESARHGKKALVDDISPDEALTLYGRGIVNFSTDKLTDFAIRELKKTAKNVSLNESDRLFMVINTGNDEINLEIAGELSKKLDEMSDLSAVDNLYERINIYVFDNPEYESLYEEIANNHGCIRTIDKYKKVAMDVAVKYPLAGFLDEKSLDYNTGLLKDDASVNVVFIGFGDVNRQLFLTYIATNQFVKLEDGKPVHAPVNYHIFDKEKAYHNKNLNNSYYRYRNEFFSFNKETLEYTPVVDTEDYLPLPELPSKEIYHHCDINSPDFYRDVKSIILKQKKGATIIFVAYGSDLENRDLATKLTQMTASTYYRGNVKIFARQRNNMEDTPFINDDYIAFGNEESAVFDMRNLDDSEEMRMTLYRHKSYALEGAVRSRLLQNAEPISEEEIDNILRQAGKRWYTSDGLKERSYRDSSRYVSVSIRGKLLMMGLDMVKEEDLNGREPLSRNDYLADYAGHDAADYYYVEYLGKNYEFSKRESIDFKEDTKPFYMSVEEHLRWNAYILTAGFVPSSLKRITESDDRGKDYRLRIHNNLTTYEGLKDFRKLMADLTGLTEEETDVIHYDYQILDDAWQMLDNLGYKIVRR